VSGYRLRPRAFEDLTAIGDFIAIDDPLRAVSFVDEFVEVFARIVKNPRAFQRRDDLSPGLRQAVHRRYIVLFKVENDETVVIVRVAHGARKLEDLI
jgi:toxin ParE1/3/4